MADAAKKKIPDAAGANEKVPNAATVFLALIQIKVPMETNEQRFCGPSMEMLPIEMPYYSYEVPNDSISQVRTLIHEILYF